MSYDKWFWPLFSDYQSLQQPVFTKYCFSKPLSVNAESNSSQSALQHHTKNMRITQLQLYGGQWRNIIIIVVEPWKNMLFWAQVRDQRKLPKEGAGLQSACPCLWGGRRGCGASPPRQQLHQWCHPAIIFSMPFCQRPSLKTATESHANWEGVLGGHWLCCNRE